MVSIVGIVADMKNDGAKNVYVVSILYFRIVKLIQFSQITDQSGSIDVIQWKNTLQENNITPVGSIVKCFGRVRYDKHHRTKTNHIFQVF